MTPLQLVLDKLPDAKKTNTGWSARCPGHEDRHASLSVSQGDDGRVLLNCHAGCGLPHIAAAMGVQVKELFAERQHTNGSTTKPPKTYATIDDAVTAISQRLGGQPSGTWLYHDVAGKVNGAVLRFDSQHGKQIQPVTRFGNGYANKHMPTPRPLYRLPELKAASMIVVTEGEKCADAARSLGFFATTSSGGAQAAKHTDFRPLAGKTVWILPDNDTPGQRYAGDVITLLSQLNPPATVKTLLLPGLSEGGDIVDWIASHGEAAEPGPMRAEIEAIAQTAAKEEQTDSAFPFPRPIPFSKLVANNVATAAIWERYIHRGCITMLVGTAKAGKTTLLSHFFRACESGGDFCDKVVQPSRVLVVTEESTRQWIDRGTPLGFKDHLEFLCRPFMSRPSNDTWFAFLSYVASVARESKFDLVVFDTLTTIWPVQDENDGAKVTEALMPLHMLTAANAGVLLVHHPRKSGGDEGMAARGSGALPGFVDAIIELKRLEPKDTASRKRTLTGYGRWDVPAEIVIEWDSVTGQYIAHGDRKAARSEQLKNTIRDLLPRERPGFDYDAIKEALPASKTARRADVLEALEVGFGESLWIRDGTGGKGKKFTYWVQE